MKTAIKFRVEKNRVLVPIGEPCRFGCRYCYTRGGEVGSSHVDITDILTLFYAFAAKASFETIQLGYDGDPFASPGRGIVLLKYLSTMGKHINFSTKAALSSKTLETLFAIHRDMQANRTILSALISLSCWDSARDIEPFTPTPSERIQTIRDLKRIGIPVFIAVRPVLPHVADSEYERIADEGLRAGCDGFILGPLYGNERGRSVRFVPPQALTLTPHQTKEVSWSARTPLWTRYEDPLRLQALMQMMEQKGGRTFLSSTDALQLIHNAKCAVC